MIVTATEFRSRFDRWAATGIRVASFIVLAAILGMFLQMLSVALPLAWQPELIAADPPAGSSRPGRTVRTTPSWVPPMAARVDWVTAGNGRLWVAVTPTGEVHGVLSRSPGLLTAPEALVPTTVTGPRLAWRVDFLLLDPSLRWLVAAQRDGRYAILRREARQFSLAAEGRVDGFEHAAIMPGRRSFLMARGSEISQWQLATSDGHLARPVLEEMRRFELEDVVTLLAPAPTGQRVAVVTATPALTLLHTTTGRQLGRVLLDAPTIGLGWYSADRLFITGVDARRRYFDLGGSAGAVTAATLFTPTLYAGYSEPALVWQSTSPDSSYEAKYSLTPLLVGTLKAAIVSMLIAAPLAVGAAIFVGFFMPLRLRDRVKPGIELLEALPTVVLGALAAVWLAPLLFDLLAELLGAIVLVPMGVVLAAVLWRVNVSGATSRNIVAWLPVLMLPLLLALAVLGGWVGGAIEQALTGGSLVEWLEREYGFHVVQRNALLVGIAMGLALIPTVFSLAEEAIHAVPRGAAAGSLALGASHWQSYRDVVLPVALPGIVSAVAMGFSRALGETMIVLMVAGNTPLLDWGVLEGVRTVSATLAIELPESAPGSLHYRVLFLAALLLFLLTFAFNTLAEMLRQHSRQAHRSLS